MDTANPSPMNLSVAAAAPVQPPADSMPPSARDDGSGPNRSFAATLADHQPKSPSDAAPAPAAGNTAAPESPGPPAAADAAPKDAKAPAKPAARSRTASGGGASPVDGNALPLWLPPAAPAAAPAPASTPAAVGLAPADRGTAVAAADLARSATQAADRASAQGATRGASEEQRAAGAALPAVTTDAEPATPTVATPPAPQLPSMAAVLAQAAAPATSAAPPAPGPSAATTDAAAPKVAAADAAVVAVAAATATVPSDTTGAPAEAAAPAVLADAAAKPSPAAAVPPPLASALATLSPKPGRPPTVGVDAVRNAGPSAGSASATPPVATDLTHAVAAVLSTETKNDVGATIAPVKVTMDATGGVLPQSLAALPDRIAAPALAQVSTPVGAPDWAHELTDRVNVLVNQNLTHAQIKLSPADLGPIEVRIALTDGQASVSFTTHSHLTSEALQAAAPRLREALGSQGYSSVNVDVSQQQFRERAPQQTRYEPEAAFGVSASAAATLAPARVAGTSSTALRLDAYA
jgi:flagellar hook-length control protein FliK